MLFFVVIAVADVIAPRIEGSVAADASVLGFFDLLAHFRVEHHGAHVTVFPFIPEEVRATAHVAVFSMGIHAGVLKAAPPAADAGF